MIKNLNQKYRGVGETGWQVGNAVSDEAVQVESILGQEFQAVWRHRKRALKSVSYDE
jgi:hypothetical protein